MEVSILFIKTANKTWNQETAEHLQNLNTDDKRSVHLYVYDCAVDDVEKTTVSFEGFQSVVYGGRYDHKFDIYNQSREVVCGDYVTVVEAGDSFSSSYIGTMLNNLKKAAGKKQTVAMPAKYYLGDDKKKKLDVFSNYRDMTSDTILVDINYHYSCYPYFFAGTWISCDYWKKHSVRSDLKYEYEKDYLMKAILINHQVLLANNEQYEFQDAKETDEVYYGAYYEPEWYYESIDSFWIPFLGSFGVGEVPIFVQYQAMYALVVRIQANLNNKDKHCVPVEEAEQYLWNLERVLKYIDDAIILNQAHVKGNTVPFYIYKLFMIIKRKDETYSFEKYYDGDNLHYGDANVSVGHQKSELVNVQLIDYVNHTLYIDASISGLYNLDQGELFAVVDGKRIEIIQNGRYSHTKVFGFVFYKRNSFRLEVPVEGKTTQSIQMVYRDAEEERIIDFSFDSHTSRIAKQFKNFYWNFAPNQVLYYKGKALVVEQMGKKQVFLRECRLLKEMLKKRNKEITSAALKRVCYHVLKPVMKRKPIWMFIDKIYKAGDSSEYIYKYANAKKDGIKKYYLVDKNAADYKRLKKEGYKPLVRGSFKHKMMFLYADMMIISNSTVFAFNGYSLRTSSYIRDLVDFHVCCVQHGMSIQKIAIAQNRLRDNTRLYFCASKYELENLTKPVYDYNGHDALKLTGVPRYDGLIDDDKRQILISPTWRMQAAVPVKTSESEARPYNPLFKESNYFKVFNSLINDQRLIDAARTYNYRIAYVLHPIVSPQIDDFDKNDMVDIIPAIGDMSYEKIFRESSLMVSDYSGVQFDFAYMRKPLVYLHHNSIPQHYEEGTYHYDTMAFGEICHENDELIDVLIEYMKNDCKMKPEYRRRADDFFHFSDHNNCQRIYDVMIDYQKNVVNPSRF